jgi:hypothetical protein
MNCRMPNTKKSLAIHRRIANSIYGHASPSKRDDQNFVIARDVPVSFKYNGGLRRPIELVCTGRRPPHGAIYSTDHKERSDDPDG